MADEINPAEEEARLLVHLDSPDFAGQLLEHVHAHQGSLPDAKITRQDGGAVTGEPAHPLAAWLPAVAWAAQQAEPESDPMSEAFIWEQAKEYFPPEPVCGAAELVGFAAHCVRSRWLLHSVARRLPRADADIRRTLPDTGDRLRVALLFAQGLAAQLEEMPAEVAAHATVGALGDRRVCAFPAPIAKGLLALLPAAGAPGAGDSARWAFAHPSLQRHLARQAAGAVLRGDEYALEPALSGLITGDGCEPRVVAAARALAGPRGMGPHLHRAARLGLPALMAACVRDGADLRQRNSCGQTPLHLAGSPEAVEWLCEELKKLEPPAEGSDLECRDPLGRTPLAQACAAGLHEVVEALLRRGADSATRSDQGVTPLMFAAQGAEEGRPALLAADHADCVAALARHCAALDSQGPQGMTALCYAALQGNEDEAAALLGAGADPRLGNADRVTPLHFAAFRGDAALCRRLVQSGADPHATDSTGRTPAELAQACGSADSGHSEVLAVLSSRRPGALGQGSIPAPGDVYQPGRVVEVHSLRSMTGRMINGQRGTVIGPQGDRVGVLFPEPYGARAVRPEHLHLVDAPPGGASPQSGTGGASPGPTSSGDCEMQDEEPAEA
eukprot:TRINITY_DN3739_c0_g1_i1.p1 TRINITY_DN3739_c0_g1~~TRINITY_DN3739_c0_g1_i1.p1  ORF type:complete len:640 (+),score=195.10 TRINITY_DN3739_c0_g1_i1:77-1921(+)